MLTAEEVLKSKHRGFSRIDFGLSGNETPEYWSKEAILKAMNDYARMACDNQRKLCSDAAEISVDERPNSSIHEYWINLPSIINAPLPDLL